MTNVWKGAPMVGVASRTTGTPAIGVTASERKTWPLTVTVATGGRIVTSAWAVLPAVASVPAA